MNFELKIRKEAAILAAETLKQYCKGNGKCSDDCIFWIQEDCILWDGYAPSKWPLYEVEKDTNVEIISTPTKTYYKITETINYNQLADLLKFPQVDEYETSRHVDKNGMIIIKTNLREIYLSQDVFNAMSNTDSNTPEPTGISLKSN